jgi:hypothetical protein
VESLQLGRRDETDYLAIASALDMIGHDFGPRSRDVEDLLMRLDATLGAVRRASARGSVQPPDATEHGTMYSYDRRVPILPLGHGIRRGRFPARVSPADVAPTLDPLPGFRCPGAEGRVLTEALK